MARRKSRNYKQSVTFTKNMGASGAQEHIGKITKLDPALKSGFLNNVVVSAMANKQSGSTQIERAALQAFTIYLSNAKAGAWDDDEVIAARSTAAGGGTVSLACKRVIRDQETITNSVQGPVHVWAEATDVPVQPGTEAEGRFTIEAWGRMILLSADTS